MRSAASAVVVHSVAVIYFGLGMACAGLAIEMPTDSNDWTYVETNQGVRSIARSIGLSDDRPQDLVEHLTYRGSVQRYAQLRYGSENSRRVVIVVDELGDRGYDFFVDRDRDRRITEGDLVPGEGRYRALDLATEIVHQDQPQHEMRRVRLQVTATGTRLSVATLGYIEGSVSWPSADESDQHKVLVRRIDGNANGLFADARDRLQMDLDGNGIWDPIAEQFAYLPVQIISGQRYASRSDRWGHRFSLTRIDGAGFLRVVVGRLPEAARIITFEAMVFADDGSAYSLRRANAPQSVPVGRYTLGSVTMTIDTGEREPWHFVFSRNGSVDDDDWIAVEADENVSIEAIGRSRFQLISAETTRAGASLSVNPRLYTEGGLLINLSCRGRQMGNFASERFHNHCDVKLKTPAGNTLSAARSGFA